MVPRTILFLFLLISAARAQDAHARYVAMLSEEATRQGIPPALADAVATVESAYDPTAIGLSGEVGLMQVMPPTAAMLGFHGTMGELADPATNIRLGVTYLAGAWRMTGGRVCDTLMKYRAGYGEQTLSLRSIIYCRRALDHLAALNSALASGPGSELPPITPEMLAADAATPTWRGHMPILMTSAELVRMRAGRRTAEDSRRFWIAEKAYIYALHVRLVARHVVAAR